MHPAHACTAPCPPPHAQRKRILMRAGQWVLSVPKRLRYFMQRDGAVLNMVLRIFLRVIAQSLQSNSPGATQLEWCRWAMRVHLRPNLCHPSARRTTCGPG